jgi:hypothetical protein
MPRERGNMSCPTRCLIVAGIGGMVPTLSKLASYYVTGNGTGAPLPGKGMIFGIFLFFILGAVLAYVLSESDLKRAFIIGIAAPGIITNIVSGVAEVRNNNGHGLSVPSITSSAHGAVVDLNAVDVPIHNEVLPHNVVDPNAKEVMPQILPERNITISTVIEGNVSLDGKAVTLIAVRQDGQETVMGSLPIVKDDTGREKNTFQISPDTISIKLSLDKIDTVQRLPSELFLSANLVLKIRIEPENDLMWALGAKRSYIASGMDTELEDIVYMR